MKTMKCITLLFSVMGIIAAASCEPVSSPTGDGSTDVPAAASTTWPPMNSDETITPAENLLTKNIYVVFDSSGSMDDSECSGNESKSDVAKRAVAEFAKQVPADANLGLLVFDGEGETERVPLATGNRAHFAAQVAKTYPGGGTPLEDAITIGYKKLTAQAKRQLGYGEYTLVVVTDGEANLGQDPTNVVNHIVDTTPIVVHTIGFCIGDQHSLNQPGRTVYKAADNPEELRKGLGAILAESETFDVTGFDK